MALSKIESKTHGSPRKPLCSAAFAEVGRIAAESCSHLSPLAYLELPKSSIKLK